MDFGYDPNGNITTENTWTYVYDLSNQLIRVMDGTNQIAEYTYNGAGQRIRKVTPTDTTVFHYDLQGHIIAETNQSGQMIAEYVYLGDQLLTMIKPGELVYYFQNDHLGTPQVLTDESQIIAWKAAYTAFGQATVSVEAVENPFRFPGQYYDSETGLHYNYFRYYDPTTGRYMTPDPIGLEGGFNLFVYVAENPVNWADPLGLKSGYRGITGLAMRLGEIRRKKAVEQFFEKWGEYICDAANTNNVDPILLFAIFKEEISHMWPPGEGWAEIYFGWGESVGPGQIRADIWSKQLEIDRDALTDIFTNIYGTAEILKTEENTLLRWRSLSNISPERLASRYNEGSASGVTDYGLRVGNFYNELNGYVNNKCSKKCE